MTDEPKAAEPVEPPPVAGANSGRRSLTGLSSEIDIAALGILMNLGFVKLSELTPFVNQISKAVITTNLLDLAIIVAVIIAYMAYTLCILFGIYQAFKEQSARRTMAMALGAFLVAYGILFMDSIHSVPITVTSAPTAGILGAGTTPTPQP